MRTIKELRAERSKLLEAAQSITKMASPKAADWARFNNLIMSADAMLPQIEAMTRAADLEAEMNRDIVQRAYAAGISIDAMAARDGEEAKTFTAWLRGGEPALDARQSAIFKQKFQAAQSVGTGADGGYTVSRGFYYQLVQAQKTYGGMIAAGFLFETDTGQAVPIPTDNDTGNVGALLGENTQATQQDIPFGSVTLGAYTYTSKIVLVSNQLMQDSAFDLDGFLSDALGTRIARAVNTHLTTGTGSSQPNGAVTAAASGYAMPTGNTTTITYDGLLELQHSVDPAYRTKGRFMMNDAALKVIKQIKDSAGRPLWLPTMAEGEPGTILGHPYTINQDMAVPAASVKSILFGDFSNYFVRRVVGVRLLRLTERYADYNQTGFVAFQRWDGNLVNAGTNPIKYLQQSAT